MIGRQSLGFALVLLAFFLFSCVDTMAKWLALAAIPSFQLAFFRYVGHFAICIGQSAHQSEAVLSLQPRLRRLVVLRSLMLASATVCNFFAIRYLPLTTTATIMFSTPMIICALSGPLLGERVGPWRWGAIVVGFVGVLLAMRPDSGFHWSMLLSIAAALGMALYTLMSRQLQGRVSVMSMQFYTGLVGTVMLTPLAWQVWVMPESAQQWTLLIAIGVAAWVGHEVFTRAHGFADASTLAPFNFSLFLYMSFWGWLVFEQLPDGNTLLAAVLIVAAGIVIWWRETAVKQRIPA